MILGIPEDFDLEVDYDSTSPSLAEETAIEKNIFRIDTEDFETLSKTYQNDLQYLNQRFQTLILLRDAEITDMINKENERIRKKLEQQKREREELERRKKQEEELKRKQEEEKQRKLEQEKKLREAQEKKAREEEAKRKEIEAQKEKEAKLKKEEEEKKLRKQKQLEDRENNVEAAFLAYKQQIKEFKENIVEVVNKDKELKKNVGVVRRKINPKFGQLSNSMRQLNQITTDIIQLMNTAQGHQLVQKFLFNFIAKAIISQAETEIVVQPNAAVPLARLASNLVQAFPDLNTFLMARFVKKCPLVIGYTCSIDTEEGRLRMGWKRNKSSSKWEEPDKYDERVAGICSLFSVLTRLNNKLYPISMSWTFLARIANTPDNLITNVHFFCIANWWEACGKYFVNTYRSQAVKLLQLLVFELSANKKLPAATRLRILADEGIHPNMKGLNEMTA